MEETQSEPEPNPSEWELVKELVFQWETDRPPDLNAWLADRCPNDSIRQEVERLVRASATSGDFLMNKAADEHLGVAARHPVTIGRYRVIEELGSGGLGIVYAAYDKSLGRKVAIKVLADQAGGIERRNRLRWDAKAASAAQHPNIVAIYDIGNDGGLDYIVMECIEGQQLNELLPADGLPVQTVLKHSLQIAGALEAAHRSGVVHRDLKPNNIMITPQGEVKILDFGLAKYDDPEMTHTSHPATIEGHFAGTVAYVSPEQAEGKAVDRRGDIFSFGCILFEMLTGRPAFQGNTPVSILGNILHQQAPRLQRAAPQIDERLDAIVERCLRKKPEERFASMAEVKQQLAELVEVETPRARLSYRTSKLLVQAGVAVGALALVSIAVALFARRPAPPPAVVQFDQVQVTTGTGLASYPAISPDGMFIAYASQSPGKEDLDLWVKQWEQPDAIKVTSNPADEYAPSFSPDGTELVYRSEQDGGGLYKMPSLGGTARLVAPRGRDGRFSPDGKWLAYWSGAVGGIMRTGSSKIWLMQSNGGAPKEFPPGFEAAAYPVWSANENKFLFLGRKAGEKRGDWWIADLDGTVHATGMSQKFLAAGVNYPSDAYHAVPSVWLPNNLVLFTARRRDATNIWAVKVNPDGSVPEAPYHWTDGTEVETYPSATINAKGLTHTVYAALTRATAIWRIPLNSAGNKGGNPQPLISDFYRLGAPSLTGDGGRMAFTSKQPRGRTIQVADFTIGATPDISLHHVAELTRPVLSGDGSTVAWLENGKGYMMAVKDDAPHEICADCGPPTHLNIDGTKVIFESGDRAPDGGPALDDLVLWAGGQKPRSLLRFQDGPHWRQSGGRFSPDGRWVAFSGWQEGDSRQILVAPVTPDGAVTANQIVKITEGPYSDLEPVWSPQGHHIYFLSNRDGYQCVWGRDVDPKTAQPVGDVFPVAHFHTANRVIRGPVADSGSIGLSASRDFLVLTLTDTKGNIWLRSGKY